MKNVVCKYLQDVRLTNYSFSNYNFCDPLKKMRYFCLFIFLNRFTYCAEFPIGLSQFNGQVAEQLIHDLYTFNYPNKTFLTTPKARRLSSHPWKISILCFKIWILSFRFSLSVDKSCFVDTPTRSYSDPVTGYHRIRIDSYQYVVYIVMSSAVTLMR